MAANSVNYNLETKTVTEWNVGCEKCHGPGGAHVRQPSQANIVNPARLDTVQATNVCIQCHSQGQPLTNPVSGKYYDWPVGFHLGMDLKNFWRLEERKLGEQTFTHFADGTVHDYVIATSKPLTRASRKHLVSALRSFLRFAT